MDLTEVSDFENYLILNVDNKYLDNIKKLPSHLQKFLQKSLSQKILQSSPYGLNKRLDFISTGALGNLTSKEYQKHLESLPSYPDLAEKDFVKNKSKEIEFSLTNNHSRKGIDTNFIKWCDSQEPDFPFSKEVDEVKEILENIEDGEINSYNELTNYSKNCSENEKILLLSALGNSFKWGNYNYSFLYNSLSSQDTFFYELQDFLQTGKENPLGVCTHIATHLEKFATDIGLEAAALNGKTKKSHHAYNIVKYKEGLIIIDYGNIFSGDSKNVEKVLSEYQSSLGVVAFEHDFFNNNSIKYKFITKDGRDFLKSIEYDATAKTLENSLLQGQIDEGLNFKIDINNSLLSTKIEFLDTFLKITTNPSADLWFQTGYDNVFNFKNSQLSVYSSIYTTCSDKLGKNPNIGFSGDLKFNTKNTELNLASQFSAALLSMNHAQVFYDLQFPLGISYTGIKNNLKIEPYLIIQPQLFKMTLAPPITYGIKLNEIKAGTKIEKNFENNSSFSCNPYLLRRMWEHGAGINFDFSSPNIELNAGVEATQSDYKFCPDKLNLSAGISVPVGNIKINFDYKNKINNYDGEITQEPSFTIGGNLNF